MGHIMRPSPLLAVSVPQLSTAVPSGGTFPAHGGRAGATIYLRITQGVFPRPVPLGPRAVGWPETEIEAVNAVRIAGKSDEEIRQLVATLEAAREVAADP